MSEYGAQIQTSNQEMVKYLECLKMQRENLVKRIQTLEQQKTSVENELENIQVKLNKTNRILSGYYQLKNRYDKTICGAEEGFKKLSESSQALLNVVQQDAIDLDRMQQSEGFLNLSKLHNNEITGSTNEL